MFTAGDIFWSHDLDCICPIARPVYFTCLSFCVLGFREQWTDKRIKMTNEVLQGIRVLKFYAWEESYSAMVTKLRVEEVNCIRSMGYWGAISNVIYTGAPTIMMMVAYMVLAISSPLTPGVVFTSMTYFSNLRMTMSMLPNAVNQILMLNVAVGRLQQFLGAEEIDDTVVERVADIVVPEGASAKPLAILLDDCSFRWEATAQSDEKKAADAAAAATAAASTAAPAAGKSDAASAAASPSKTENDSKDGGKAENSPAVSPASVPSSAKPEVADVLSHVNLQIVKGSLTVIVGGVGSGKSSLLMGLLGEIRRTSGSVKIRGSVSYCQQQTWMQSASLRDNILFGAEYDPVKYKRTIEVCALSRDLEVLTDGDMTEIGEKGINLSGGQKQVS
jgi:ATP-binding cassette subfamily C (CFTR/MRP) protein 1